MKTMKIEKQMLFADTIHKVNALEVKDGLQYHQEDDGIRAIGPLFIKGQYEAMDGTVQDFQEILDMDIMAPQHKLNGEDFFIRIEEYHGTAENESIHLYITMSIHGLIEEQDVRGEVNQKQLATMKEEPAALQMSQSIPPISAQEKAPVPVVTEVIEEEQPVEISEKSQDTFDEFEDLFEDAGTTYTSYRMIVAKPNDTYASIAQRYEVDEADLRSGNHDKEISEKTLVILP